MPSNKYTTEFINTLLSEYTLGETTVTLGRKYDIAPSTISTLLRKGGYTPRPKIKDTVDMDLLAKLRLQGKTTAEICAILGVKKNTLIRCQINKLPSPLTDKFKRKYLTNTAYFKCIDSPKKAYILGFLAADGGVSPKGDLRMELSLRDKSILEQIVFEICPNYVLKLCTREKDYKGNKRIVETAYFSLKCKTWKKDLEVLGIIPNKTYKSTCMPNLRKDLKRHYIRGYFDGNGSVGKYKVEVCGGHDLLTSILNELQSEGIGLGREVKKKPKQLDSRFGIYSKIDLQLLYNYLYSNALLFLERKKLALECHLTP